MLAFPLDTEEACSAICIPSVTQTNQTVMSRSLLISLIRLPIRKTGSKNPVRSQRW